MNADAPMAWIEETLTQLAQNDLLRTLRTATPGGGGRVDCGSQSLLNLSSNNYLGLAEHPHVRSAVSEAVQSHGWGAGASQLVSGFSDLHEALVARLAAFEHAEDCVLFPTGYQANLGAVTALVGRGDRVLLDKLSHASLIDGARLSGAEVRSFRHRDLDHLARLLQKSGGGRTLVLTDSVFSMDGDLAPLPGLCELCATHGAMLLVDEAHATGVLGPGGCGAVAEFGCEAGVHVRVGTLSKALGGIGGFAVGSRSLCDLLRNRARPAIYTTALPPAACAGALAALDVLQNEPERVTALQQRARELRRALQAHGVELPPCDGREAGIPIVPVVFGPASAALAAAADLLQDGFLAPAIRPPTVAPGTSRLRLSLVATHDPADLARVAERIASLWRNGKAG